MKLPFGCLPLPSLQMWSTAEHLRYHVRCFSKYERWGRGTLSEMALASIPLRDGLRDGGDSSWFPDSPCHCSSGNICEFSLQRLDSSRSHGDREGDSLGSSNRASPADGLAVATHCYMRDECFMGTGHGCLLRDCRLGCAHKALHLHTALGGSEVVQRQEIDHSAGLHLRVVVSC